MQYGERPPESLLKVLSDIYLAMPGLSLPMHRKKTSH